VPASLHRQCCRATASPSRREESVSRRRARGRQRCLFETPSSQVYRFIGPPASPPDAQARDVAVVEVVCERCGRNNNVQANLGQTHPLRPRCLPFPKDNVFRCPGCAAEVDLGDLRRQIEVQTKKAVVA
jgi:hypothetical protein